MKIQRFLPLLACLLLAALLLCAPARAAGGTVPLHRLCGLQYARCRGGG